MRPCHHIWLAIYRISRLLSAFASQNPVGQRHHAVLTTQLGQGHTALSLAQDDHDLGLGESALLHMEYSRSGRRENSTHEPR